MSKLNPVVHGRMYKVSDGGSIKGVKFNKNGTVQVLVVPKTKRNARKKRRNKAKAKRIHRHRHNPFDTKIASGKSKASADKLRQRLARAGIRSDWDWTPGTGGRGRPLKWDVYVDSGDREAARQVISKKNSARARSKSNIKRKSRKARKTRR